MSWTLNVGHLAPGAIVTYAFHWNYDDAGVQFVHAFPAFFDLGHGRIIGETHLEVLHHGVQVQIPSHADRPFYIYTATVRNNGPNYANVDLRGDGV